MRPPNDRAAEISRRLKERGLSKAEAARRIGYHTEAGTSYVRQVLNGFATSAPILDAIEEKVLAVEPA